MSNVIVRSYYKTNEQITVERRKIALARAKAAKQRAYIDAHSARKNPKAPVKTVAK